MHFSRFFFIFAAHLKYSSLSACPLELFREGIELENHIQPMPQEQQKTRDRQRTDIREPRRYTVTIYNDDFTTMEFVVKLLVEVFFKSEAEAETLMMTVHHSQKAVVGIYTYDIAVSKVQKATRMAREAGFPLRLSYEPEGSEN